MVQSELNRLQCLTRNLSGNSVRNETKIQAESLLNLSQTIAIVKLWTAKVTSILWNREIIFVYRTLVKYIDETVKNVLGFVRK